ncbi:MAG: thiamine pyrophosphate-dependent dehydrogenase E1 component subunit alpha [Candidatus Tectomicrobia bacterium]|nr:thiamine pyrophosphate-dependent dehydrogenase E1 component subunit alpha [Candidatus Tectomicrobia bacterium]
MSGPLDEKTRIDLYRTLLVVRFYENSLPALIQEGLVVGSMHVCTGQEAVGVGICRQLRPDDYVTSGHRGHAHYIAKGVDLGRMTAEIFGRATGLGGGRAGHMLIADHRAGILGGSAVVGGNVPVAVGAALSSRLRGSDQVAVCFFGDGGSCIGSFHESLNMAAVWNLPVLFVCENNRYALTTPLRETVAGESVAARGAGYGVPGVEVDGNDVLAVYEVGREAIARARRGEGPSLIEAKTYRIEPFSNRDRGGYQPPEEVEFWRARDPIDRMARHLRSSGLLDEERDASIRAEAEKTVRDAIEYARSSPPPDPAAIWEHLYRAPAPQGTAP